MGRRRIGFTSVIGRDFNWERFCSQVLNEIENKDNPDLTETNFKHRLFLLFAELFSPSFWGRPINFFRFLKANIKYVLQNRMQKYTT